MAHASSSRNPSDQNDQRKPPQIGAINKPASMNKQLIWYCPSRWLLAHHDIKANIQTLSSHMCLADLYNDGESLLSLIDFKQRPAVDLEYMMPYRPPYDCRMRVYRGQQLICNHFLEDVPSCLLATSINLPNVPANQPAGRGSPQQQDPLKAPSSDRHQPFLTLAINDDVYFYHKLKPSHRLSLEDEDFILETLNKSEVDAWRMVKQNKVDIEAMRELLTSLSQEFGNQDLTSHSNNFLALDSNESRKHYLAAWRFKRLQNGLGEHLMSMDTICCAAARLKYSSPVTRSGDFGQTRDASGALNLTRWNRILDIQRDGLVLGTEDRHLLVYELRSVRTRMECHYRLPAVPDHILVERKSPSSFDHKGGDLKTFTYKILVSCRNCRIYSIDALYLNDKKSPPSGDVKELLILKSNVLEMSWTVGGNEQVATSGSETRPWELDFIVASLDRRVSCFNSYSGQCKWVVELELPITSIVNLPRLQLGNSLESSLVGVASQANRVDFYVSSTGRIVDSIYFGRNDYPQAMTFGRFGREDNCLCLTTNLGHLLIFILKRTAKFAHGQCLSSAASYAADTLENCSQLLQSPVSHTVAATLSPPTQQSTSDSHGQKLKLDKPASLPSAFVLSKSSSSGPADHVLESMLHQGHDCNQIDARAALDSSVLRPQLQIPTKERDFVDQILEQSRSARRIGRAFVEHMTELRDKIKSTLDKQQIGAAGEAAENLSRGNRVTILKTTGLGNVYRVSILLRINLSHYVATSSSSGGNPRTTTTGRRCLVKPFRLTLKLDDRAQQQQQQQQWQPGDSQVSNEPWVVERMADFKLIVSGEQTGDPGADSSIVIEVCVLAEPMDEKVGSHWPIHMGTISVPTC